MEGVCKNHGEYEKRFYELTQRVTVTEESTKSAHHRLDDMKEHTKAIYELAFEVRSFGANQEQIIEQQGEILQLLKNHDERLIVIENQPGKTALKAWHWLAITFVGGAIGMVFAICTDHVKKMFGG